MKKNKLSALLATGIMIFIALACGGDGESPAGNQNGGNTTTGNKSSSTDLTINRAEMRKDNGGEMSSDATTGYTTTDRTFHCYINWDNPKAGAKIKFVYTVVDAGGMKNETLKEIPLTTENEFQNEAYGKLKMNTAPPKGSYKVDVFVNDKLAKSVPFTVQ